MITSHKGEILALKNQLIPITKDTLFHASYDRSLHGYSRNGKIIPMGYRKSLGFNGVDTYINLGNFDSRTSWTFETYWYTSSFSSYAHLLSAINQNDFTCKIGKDGDTTVQRRVYFYTSALGAALISNTSLAQNTWYHIAFTFDGTTLKIYINGVLDNSSTTSATSMPSTQYKIGNWNGEWSNGRQSDTRIWDYARSAQQIKDSMNIDLPYDETGLLRYFKFNEGSGDIVYDYSNGDDCQISGGINWDGGRTVSTLRPDVNKFNGTVAIEESTTNEMNLDDFYNNAIATNWVDNYETDGNAIGVRQYEQLDAFGTLNNPVYRVRGMIRIGNAGGGDIGTLYAGNTYTFSIYLRRVRGINPPSNMQFDIVDRTGTPNFIGTVDTNLTDDWKLFTTTALHDNSSIYHFVDIGTYQDTGYWEYCCPQIEHKGFMTSFAIGARSSGRLNYPASVINTKKGSVNLWMKINAWSSGDNRPFDGCNTNNANHFTIAVNSSRVMAWYHVVTTDYTIVGSTPISLGVWYMITITWDADANTRKLYINSNLEMTGQYKDLGINSDGISIGGYSGGGDPYVLNGFVDEVRIEDEIVTDDEILAWYQSDAPFYNEFEPTAKG